MVLSVRWLRPTCEILTPVDCGELTRALVSVVILVWRLNLEPLFADTLVRLLKTKKWTVALHLTGISVCVMNLLSAFIRAQPKHTF